MFELTPWLVPHSGSAGRTVFEGSREVELQLRLGQS